MADRFPDGRLHAVRPAALAGLCLLVFEEANGARASLWSSLTGEHGDDVPVPVTGDTVSAPTAPG